MAAFVAASDETSTPGPDGLFIYGGWAARESDWGDWFEKSWAERVLNLKYPITEFHTKDLKNRHWRFKNKMSERNAEDRMDEAARIIRSAGYLTPFTSSINKKAIKKHLIAPLAAAKLEMPKGTAVPDYFGFLAFAAEVVKLLPMMYDDVERVDFVVERNGKITDYITRVRAQLIRFLEPEDARLVGEVIPDGKDRLPLQAADFLLWHLQKDEANGLSRTDYKRLWKMLSCRQGHKHEWESKELKTLAAGIIARARAEGHDPDAD